MTSVSRLAIVAVIQLGLAGIAHAQQPIPHPCNTMPMAKQFDFWIGQWDVTPWAIAAPTPAQTMGFNDVHPILEHCVISENWRGARGGEGKSYNYYDTNLKKWRQIWMSDSGGALDYTGEFKDGAMRFVGWNLDGNGNRVEQKLTFFAIAADTVRQLFEASPTAGRPGRTPSTGATYAGSRDQQILRFAQDDGPGATINDSAGYVVHTTMTKALPETRMPQHRAHACRAVAIALLGSLAVIGRGSALRAQEHDHMAGMTNSRAANADLHMEMSPKRPATSADSARAAAVAAQLRTALVQYMDTTAAVKDGYKMFMPQVKEQKVYHFTNNWRAVQEAFRFDPEKPASLLYQKKPDGQFVLVGAMYTAPKRFGADKLDSRVPLSIARWHKHVNWCLPKKGDAERWLERKDGQPVFGPESPIATQSACDAVGGTFHDSIFGWMLHANVFASDDPATIWGDEHAGHDMHSGMKMGAPGVENP